MVQSERIKNILILGAAVIDKIVHIEHFTGQEEIDGLHKETIVRGNAYNVQFIVNKFDVNHTLLVPVGKGEQADMIRNKLQTDPAVHLVEEESMDNGWKITFIEKDGGRIYLTVPGLEANWQKEWFKDINLADYDLIYVSGHDLKGDSGKVIVEQIKKGKRSEAKVIFAPSCRLSSLDPEVLNEILKLQTIVHCNKSQLKTLYPEQESIVDAAKQLHGKTKEPVVVTMGQEGCYYYSKGSSDFVPSKYVGKRDETISLGDYHAGAFISGLVRGYSIEVCCQLGNDIAANMIESLSGKLAHEKSLR